MSYCFLPKEIRDLIGEFNVDHRPNMRAVLAQLQEKCDRILLRNQTCMNCSSYIDETNNDDVQIAYILYRKYTFCSTWCLHHGEDHLRLSWRRMMMSKKLVHATTVPAAARISSISAP